MDGLVPYVKTIRLLDLYIFFNDVSTLIHNKNNSFSFFCQLFRLFCFFRVLKPQSIFFYSSHFVCFLFSETRNQPLSSPSFERKNSSCNYIDLCSDCLSFLLLASVCYIHELNIRYIYLYTFVYF